MPPLLRALRLRPALLLAAVLVAVPAAAQHSVDEVSFDPAAATWQDDVTLTLRGVSTCVVFHDATTIEFEAGVGQVVVVALDVNCTLAPPVDMPFTLTVPLPHLAPGRYPVRVELLGSELAEAEWTVFHAGMIQVDVPDAPTDAAPFSITLSGVASCGFGAEASLQPGNVIQVLAYLGCHILPPAPHFTQEELEVGPLPAGTYEVRLYDSFGPPFHPTTRLTRRTVTVYDDQGCVPSDVVLCLDDDRFLVRVAWQGFQGGGGDGRAVPLAGRDDTGTFWFFDEDNVELTVKVLDGCGVNGHYWVFVASGSTVEYWVTVIDKAHPDQGRTYHKPLGETPALIHDTAAFATCP